MNQRTTSTTEAPEYNLTGIDLHDKQHLPYQGQIIDLHAHVFMTRETDPSAGPPIGAGPGPGASLRAAEVMLETARQFGIEHTVTMCLPTEIPVFRERFGNRIGFNGWIGKGKIDEPDDNVYRALDQFLELGVQMFKLWAAPRGRNWGLVIDAPYRIKAVKRARDAGVKTIMVHVADPDHFFKTIYSDRKKYGTKLDQYVAFERMLNEFPDVNWIAAHMGGDPEHPDHLEELLDQYPNLYFDTSATKWQIREVSKQQSVYRNLICRQPDRFLFGVDLVTRHHLEPDHYASRYWCQRTLWESDWTGPSPIADPEFPNDQADQMASDPTHALPKLIGLQLPNDVLQKIYIDNAKKLLAICEEDLTSMQPNCQI